MVCFLHILLSNYKYRYFIYHTKDYYYCYVSVFFSLTEISGFLLCYYFISTKPIAHRLSTFVVSPRCDRFNI